MQHAPTATRASAATWQRAAHPDRKLRIESAGSGGDNGRGRDDRGSAPAPGGEGAASDAGQAQGSSGDDLVIDLGIISVGVELGL